MTENNNLPESPSNEVTKLATTEIPTPEVIVIDGEEYVKVKKSEIESVTLEIQKLVYEKNQMTNDVLMAIEFINMIKGVFTDKKGNFDASNIMKLVSAAMLPGGAERLAKQYDLNRLAPLFERYAHLIQTKETTTTNG